MKRLVPALATLALAITLVACSQQASLTVKLGSSGGTVIRGDSVSIPVTVSNASGSVNLSVSGAPSGVTASLASATLSGGATSTTLDVQVAPAASDGSATLTVDAVQGSNAASATYALTISSLSVTGSVVDVYGNAVSGATVAIQGTTATTDASGSFTIGGVAVPYNLIVKQIVSSVPAAQVFEGLTSATPVVLPSPTLTVPAMPLGATISGNLSAAVATGYEARVCAQSTSTWMSGCDTVAAGSTAYSIGVGWAAGSSVPVTVYAIEVATDSNGFATGYSRYGTATGSVSDGGTPTIDVSWGSAPSSTAITGNVNLPAGFYLANVNGAADLSAATTLPLFAPSGTSGSPLPTSFMAAVPQLGGMGNTLVVSAYTSGMGAETAAWKQGVSGGSSVTFDLATPPTQTAPADGATGIGVGATLSMSSLTGAATFVLASTSQAIAVTTTKPSITIPDLSSVGMSLGSSAGYTWEVVVTPTAATPEAAGTGWISDWFRAFWPSMFGGPASNLASGSVMLTTTRSFTTP